MILFDFNKGSNLDNWTIVNDVVMGGKSNAKIAISEDGHAVFQGDVSLENNGGFSSLRYNFDRTEIVEYSKISLRIKGGGKRYQFRIKQDREDRHSYIHYFETTGEWQTISISLAEMEAFFRGRKLEMSNFSAQVIEELAILIGNKKAEHFTLEMDKITLVK